MTKLRTRFPTPCLSPLMVLRTLQRCLGGKLAAGAGIGAFGAMGRDQRVLLV